MNVCTTYTISIHQKSYNYQNYKIISQLWTIVGLFKWKLMGGVSQEQLSFWFVYIQGVCVGEQTFVLLILK